MIRIQITGFQVNCQPPCEAVSWNGLTATTLPWDWSASLWGCELKYQLSQPVRHVNASASLWGCELKYFYCLRYNKRPSQPPCEAVSWNTIIQQIFVAQFMSASLWGCELKCKTWRNYLPVLLSASLWGCELKFNTRPYSAKFKGRQPPCEAVSWNMGTTEPWHIPIRQPPCEAVSWNRHTGEHCITDWLSASLWGCELKSGRASKLRLAWSQPPCEAVSWNIQWAKRKIVPPFRQPPCEAVSWNSIRIPTVNTQRRQPPCEAVSWNMGAISGIGNAVKSASLWGCELKCMGVSASECFFQSASLWGCELKYHKNY